MGRIGIGTVRDVTDTNGRNRLMYRIRNARRDAASDAFARAHPRDHDKTHAYSYAFVRHAHSFDRYYRSTHVVTSQTSRDGLKKHNMNVLLWLACVRMHTVSSVLHVPAACPLALTRSSLAKVDVSQVQRAHLGLRG